jgi:tetratricopeptide (TPR) repeat protein
MPRTQHAMSRLRFGTLWFAILAVLGATTLAWVRGGLPISTPRSQLLTAEQSVQAGNLLKADELLARFTKETPDDARGHFLYAQVLRRLERTADAEFHLGRAGELGLPLEDGRREFGLLYAALDFSLAEGALQFTLNHNPYDVEVLQALAEGYTKTRRWRQAELAFERLLELETDRIDVLFKRGEMYMTAERLAGAESDFREIAKLAPRNYRARMLLCHCLLADARMAEAEPELRWCRAARPDSPNPLIGLATCAVERQDYNAAVKLLEEALDLDPASLQALNELATVKMMQGRYEEAIPILQFTLRLDGKDKQATLKLAQVFRRTGKPEQAKELEQKYQALDKAEAERSKQQRGSQ